MSLIVDTSIRRFRITYTHAVQANAPIEPAYRLQVASADVEKRGVTLDAAVAALMRDGFTIADYPGGALVVTPSAILSVQELAVHTVSRRLEKKEAKTSGVH